MRAKSKGPRPEKSGPRQARARREGPHEATFVLDEGAGAAARRRVAAVEAALLPESRAELEGSVLHVRRLRGGRALEVRIGAMDLATLRAAVNSNLRVAGLALEVSRVAAGGGEEE